MPQETLEICNWRRSSGPRSTYRTACGFPADHDFDMHAFEFCPYCGEQILREWQQGPREVGAENLVLSQLHRDMEDHHGT